jgi:dienelactone hydrolase
VTSPTGTIAAWRRRFLAPAVGFPSWARDAPDRLVYSSNESGKWEVYAWDRQADTRRQLTDRPEGTGGARIDPSGATVWWLDDQRGDERGRWVAQPFGGGTAIAVPDLPAGYSSGLLLGRKVTVVGTTDETGTVLRVLRPGAPPAELYRHRQQAWAAALSRDETLLAVEHSERGDMRNPAVRILDLRGAALAEIDDGPGHSVEAIAWSPVEGDLRLLLSHERDGLSRPLIWQHDRQQRQEIEIDLPGEVTASWYPDGAGLLIGHRHRGRSELFRLDLGRAELTRLEVPAGSIAAARVRPDGELWFQWTDAATAPEVRSARGTVLRPAGDPAPPGVAYRDLSAGEAGSVHAFVAEPPDARPHPTLFFVHGGPESHVGDAFSPAIQAFVDHGFAVVAVNYRGSSGYGKAWRDALVGRPGFTELEDIAAVCDLAVEEGIADPERCVIHGRSWGGYLTLLGLGVQPERWALGLANVPVADYVAAYEEEMEPLKAYDRALFGGSPDDVPDLYRERSPITYVERVRAPLLVIVGENDPRCPPRQIDNYLARLRQLGKEHEVHRYEAGHASLRVEESVRQLELMLDFCARHLGSARPD